MGMLREVGKGQELGAHTSLGLVLVRHDVVCLRFYYGMAKVGWKYPVRVSAVDSTK